MKKRKLFILISATVLLLALSLPVFAAAYSKNITVYPGINIFIDDVKLNPKDVNGNPVEVFSYNGTTYLPVRAISEALGQVVQWDGDTNSVYVGKHTGDKPAVWLTDLDDFWRSGLDYKQYGITTKDNLGIEHQHSIQFYGFYNQGPEITYKLNGQYSRLTGTFYQIYTYKSFTEIDDGSILEIYGDGELLWKGAVRGGLDPVTLNVDVSGVLELNVRVHGYKYWIYSALGDLGLWT